MAAMSTFGAALVLIAATIATGNPAPSPRLQAPANFSGHWLLVSIKPERPDYVEFWLGTEATVTQDAANLVVTRISPSPKREARFTFGSERRNEYEIMGQRTIRDSRASVSATTLLISTDTTEASGQRWLSNISRWSLDGDGTLVVGDTEICGRGECPSVITTLRFKRAR